MYGRQQLAYVGDWWNLHHLQEASRKLDGGVRPPQNDAGPRQEKLSLMGGVEIQGFGVCHGFEEWF